MGECICDKLIYKGLVSEKDKLDSSVFFAPESYYEVVRVIDRKAVFLDDHIERLRMSVASASRHMLMDGAEIKEAFYRLISISMLQSGNIKISFNYSGQERYSLLYISEALYPDSKLYKTGARAILYNAERDRPAIKLFNYQLRSRIYDKLVRTGAYEALLVNPEGKITEGSKSNVFFIAGDTIITAPSEMVLAGITRKYVLDLCREKGVRVEERCLGIDELGMMDSVFISGTSPKILPVSEVDGHLYKIGNKHLLYLMKAYNSLIDRHIAIQS